MLELVKETHIPFSRLRYIGYIASGTLVVLTLVFLLINGGPNYGIDFEGGSKIRLDFTLIEGEEGKSFTNLLERELRVRKPGIEVTLTGEETVSAAFGKELQWDAILALLLGMALILIYIWIRVDFRFGLGTVLAVFHDAWVTLGIITLAGIRVDITVIAALLTIIGYSVNDSIVVSKQIQEFMKTRRGATLTENIDAGINATLSRTIITSLTTLFVALALVIFASGTAIFPFALTMTIGIVIGTYSSAFIVAPLVIELDKILPYRRRRA
jgi:preprotein translocase SecF subunit